MYSFLQGSISTRDQIHLQCKNCPPSPKNCRCWHPIYTIQTPQSSSFCGCKSVGIMHTLINFSPSRFKVQLFPLPLYTSKSFRHEIIGLNFFLYFNFLNKEVDVDVHTKIQQRTSHPKGSKPKTTPPKTIHDREYWFCGALGLGPRSSPEAFNFASTVLDN